MADTPPIDDDGKIIPPIDPVQLQNLVLFQIGRGDFHHLLETGEYTAHIN